MERSGELHRIPAQRMKRQGRKRPAHQDHIKNRRQIDFNKIGALKNQDKHQMSHNTSIIGERGGDTESGAQ